ncbi:hypothetical protein O9X98_08700 [Agrobacterium salinitolerans]|nr:hypothetical protein [Agrobacterium salinitolerans]
MNTRRPSLVRYHDGQFYQSADQMWTNQGLDDVPGAAVLVMHPTEERQAAALYSGETQGRSFDAMYHFLHGRKPQKRPASKEVEFDLGDDHAERKLAAEARIERLLVIDNDIWLRIHEPTLAVIADDPMEHEPQIRRTVFTEEPRFSNFGSPPDAIAHRIDQTDRWLAHRRPTGRETLRVCAEDIRVEMPEAFCFDPARNTMLRATEAFVELFGPEIHTWNDDLISAYVEIRKRLRAHLANPAVCAIEDIAEDIPPVLARIPRRTEAFRTVWRACEHALAEEASIEIAFRQQT